MALHEIEMDDYLTVHPVYLLWRDSFDIAQMIFGNPIFHHDMCLDPHKVFTEHDGCEYGEWMSSEEVSRIQVSQCYCSPSILIRSSGTASCQGHNRSNYIGL